MNIRVQVNNFYVSDKNPLCTGSNFIYLKYCYLKFVCDLKYYD